MQPGQQQDELEPKISSDQILDSPVPNNQKVDTPYAPATTPRSRRALHTTREEPPLTRLRARVTPQDNVTQYETND